MKRRTFVNTMVAGTLPWAWPRHAQASLTFAVGAQAEAASVSSGLFVSIHHASTSRYDFRTSVEGIAKAGVRAVEVDIAKVRQFVQGESVATAKRLLDDLGVKPVSSSNHLGFVDATATQLQSGAATVDALKEARDHPGDRVRPHRLSIHINREQDARRLSAGRGQHARRRGAREAL
jgi:hypothetical protein